MARKRRGRGEGSVYEKNGRWYGQVHLGYDPAGRRKRKSVTGATKAEVQRKIRKLLDDVDTGIARPTDSMTVKQLLEIWNEGTVKTNRRQTTYSSYRTIIDLHIVPFIGMESLDKLNAGKIDAFFIRLERDGRSSHTRKQVYGVLHRVLEVAVERRLIPYNPCNGVERPRIKREERPTYDREQVAKLLGASQGERLHAALVLSVMTGMRVGEVFGLQWDDIDFENGTLRVARQLQEVRGKFFFDAPKSSAGKRNIALPEIAVDALKDHRARMMAEGNIGAETVFCDTDGKYLRRSNVRRRFWVPTVEKAGLPFIRWHDLRHTHATLLIGLRENIKIIAERLGHSNPSLTMSTYSHVIESMQRETANKLNEAFPKPIAAS